MRFTIHKDTLLKGLALVSKAIPAKAELPLFLNFKLSLTEKGLEVLGSDGNITILTIIPFAIGDKEIIRNSQEGSVLVDARNFTERIRSLDEEYLTIEVVDNSIIKINTANYNSGISSIRAEEYPDVDLSLIGTTLTIPAKELQALAETTAFAASNKENVPYLTAVNLALSNSKLVATATDTARLARKTVEIDSEEKFTANIPAKRFLDIVRSFEGNEEVTLVISDKKAAFSFGNSIISTRLISGNYPDTRNIFPKNFNHYLEVKSSEILKAIERASLCEKVESVVKIVMDEDEVEIKSRSDKNDRNSYSNEKLTVFQYSGERLEISFRGTSIAEAIRACRSEDITLCFVGEMKPFVVKNVKDPSVEMLVTPLRS